MRPWICFFSQTGSEIANIVKITNKIPDVIIFNSRNTSNICNELLDILKNNKHICFVNLYNKPTCEEYEQILSKYKSPLVTLHGYLRIIPEYICNKYEIYNLDNSRINKLNCHIFLRLLVNF